ncbi:phosphate ABC transporter permease subunit PstC [Minwuia sp.]|uniref:phosphate ABC transporter permease subunit PstC n=1 Tax=Minwuia sp. TaxID=2493630 RepID=UPI003A8FD7D0
MIYWIAFAALALFWAFSYRAGRSRALAVGGQQQLHSLPGHYGAYAVIWTIVPALVVLVVWAVLQPVVLEGMIVASLPEARQSMADLGMQSLISDVHNLAVGDRAVNPDDPDVRRISDSYAGWLTASRILMIVSLTAAAILGFAVARLKITPSMRARNRVERFVMGLLIVSSTIAIFTTVGIVLSLFYESIAFFQKVPFYEFLFGLQWSPQTAIRADQVGQTGSFGAIPVFAGTLLISVIALIIAAPVGLMSAIYMAEYASPRMRGFIKPALEILAGVPTVVYGFFAALIVAPMLRDGGATLGIGIDSESALAAGLVMGVMIIPFVSSLSDDVITAVPRSLREGSYGLGATRSETIRNVIVPAALPGIVGALLLAASRAIGETMIVVMAAGLSAKLTVNPFEAVTTVTVQIVTLLTGDSEFDSPKTLAAFALGLMLFFVTLALNVIALRIVRKYREKYD